MLLPECLSRAQNLNLFSFEIEVIENFMQDVSPLPLKSHIHNSSLSSNFFLPLLLLQVFDEDVGQDERLGVVKLPLIELVEDCVKECELRLMPSLDMLKIKDKKDRGTITVKVLYHEFDKEEQLAALEEEKRVLEERKKLKDAGVIGSTMDAVGSGIGSGVGLVGSGIGAGVGAVGSGFGAVGSGLSKAGKFVGRTFTGHSSSRRSSGSTTPVNYESGGGARPLPSK
ncbi:hypothetical protein Leryth_023200 [Lithospermum erythrorhizon]|nr:hypothetical protein Leryth_023200 [Lithospermum erythrorhizon]